ncbi:S9 family peptidase [Candidatus Sulfidibacterium hydrothermale]|uniref:S9 family peptidase n=1 Tax=Candidatus Sulfidibacterium hydrothermale TaxID=2875962 RepID=UPI001F0A46A6|nr:S9 family peptidase [Candidatus Sulfidibacterium hydrothermale]UBM62523.1 S9 family peptidase [Candidatus Sulfidibacterium hydrothermale]
MKKHFSHVAILFFFAIPSFLFSQTKTSKTFQLKDLRKLVRISSPRISPDGNKVAFITSKPDWKEDKTQQAIRLVNIRTKAMRQLTFHREKLSQLRWSPDGKKLAFLAKDPATKETQLFVMPMNGGDAVCVTRSKTGVDSYAWSPDGKQFAFIAQDTVPNPKAIKHHEDAFRVTDNNYMVRKAVQPWHLWVISSEGGKARQLTHGSWSLGTDQGSMSNPAWTADGKSIVFCRYPDVWEGNAWHSVLGKVDVKSGKITTIVEEEGATHPAFAPGNHTLAFMRPRHGDQNNGFAVYIKQNGKITDATAGLARNINRFIWLPDGKNLLLFAEKGTREVMWKQPVNGKAVLISFPDIFLTGKASVAPNGTLAFTANTPSHPSELYVMKSVNDKPERLTNLNAFVDSLSLAKNESIDWKLDGFHEDGVLTYPVHFEKGKKYPLVLVIHGGPEGASTLRFSPLVQLLAARGFFIFQPNYRGSINLGDAYQHAIYRNTGKGPGEDVMAGLKKVLEKGFIDKTKIGVTGWSYGGYMTSWLIGNYPDVWKAAVSGAALNDWVMDYTIAYYQKGDLYFFGGSPWVKKYWKIWREQSPIEFATKVKAPTLIMGDAGDPNVPIVNSYEMFHALRDNGVTTEFYVYPVNTHFPHDIVRTTDVYRRWIEWMVKYLQ